MKKVVSIVDENSFFQHLLINVIKSEDKFELGKVYNSAEEAMEMLRMPPDIAFVEIHLPGKSGIDLLKILHAKSSTQCIIYTKHKDDEHILLALENGAAGYIIKESKEKDIHFALSELEKGGVPMSPYIAKRILSFFRKSMINQALSTLSERELEVLHLLAKGLQYKQIAAKLYISSETVKRHLRNIYQKLGVQNKIEAINKLHNSQDRHTISN